MWESVTIPSSVSEFGWDFAFRGCKNLKSVSCASAIIRKLTFSGLITLETVILTEDVREIGWQCFGGCSSLVEINLPNSIVKIDWAAFMDCSSLKTIKIPNSISVLNKNMFAGCSSLEEVELPANLKEISDQVFFQCSSLRNVVLPSSLEKLGRAVFLGCETLKEIILPENVREIGDAAFSGCRKLGRIVFGSAVKNIGEGAFVDAPNIKTVVAYPIVPPVCKNAAASPLFDDEVYSNAYLYVPEESYDEYKNTVPWSYFNYVEYTESNVVKFELDNVVYHVTSTEPGNIASEVFDISDPTLEAITIPESVTYHRTEYKVTAIADYAFAECVNLRTLTLPSSIKEISNSAFIDSESLTVIMLKAKTPPVFVSTTVSRAADDEVFVPAVFALCLLYVPDEAIAAYRADGVWKKFESILPLSSSISGVIVDSDVNSIVYDLYGRRINPRHLTPGIYIVNGKKTAITNLNLKDYE